MATLGIDPAKCTGLAVVDSSGRLVTTGHVQLALSKGSARDNLRMYKLLESYLYTWIHRTFPSSICYEATIYPHASAACIHYRMGLVIQQVAHFWGLPLYTVAPSEVKKAACGNGKASGAQVAAAANYRWEYTEATNPQEDEGAALWVAEMGRLKHEESKNETD